eukprot:TRINITY_DN12518_c0_g2_i1.p1 TRINITY_DN12518_c0_g2~~TRINITY_DN12518_c0_g2_i1.p1  ORF type:complete len:281 (+),score=25.49 TRINITY_DN12518_c0_g2_i1:57-845(+)
MVGVPIAPPSFHGHGCLEVSSPLGNDKPLASAECAVRNAFVRRVYGILLMQLVITIVLGAGVRHVALTWIQAGSRDSISALLILSFIGSVAVLCAVRRYPYLMRQYPTTHWLLLTFTMCKAVMVGMICAAHTVDSVLVAVAITAVFALLLAVFACQTTFDLTGCGPYVICGAIALFCFGMCFWIDGVVGPGSLPAFPGKQLFYAVFVALLFCCYLVFDTQQILAGKNRYQYSVDDYALGTISLYIDAVQLFFFLVRIVGKRN